MFLSALLYGLLAVAMVPATSGSDNLSPETPCQYSMDLVFIVDKSGSIDEWEFEISKIFVARVVSNMDISVEHTHVALALYSSAFHHKFCFNEYTSVAELNQTIRNLECPECIRGWTVTGVAMQHARTEMLTPECGVRDSAVIPRIVVVLTDGKSTEHNQGYPDGWLATQSTLLWVESVTRVIAVGVGPGFTNDHPELNMIATGNDHVFATTDFHQLMSLLGNVSEGVCEAAKCGVQTCFEDCPQGYVIDEIGCPTCECLPFKCEKDVDLVFLLDKSGSIDAAAWVAEKNVVTQLISHFDVALDKTRVALNLFASEPRPRWCFTEYTSNGPLESAVTNLTCPECVRGLTAIGEALEYTRDDTLQAACGKRGNYWPKVVVLLTDGKSTEPYDYWRTQADILKSAPKTQVAAIGVGSARVDHLQDVASSDSLVYNANSFSDLFYIEEIARALCEAAGTTTHLPCLPGWSLDPYSDRCYKWFDVEIEGNQQTVSCNSHHGSEPARILKKGTFYFLKAISSGGFWLNIEMSAAGELVWAPDTPLEYTRWATGQPWGGSGDCFVKEPRGKQRWSRTNCDAAHAYVCSLPKLLL